MPMPRFWGKLTRLDNALEKACRQIRLHVEKIEIPVLSACNLVVAENIYSPIDLPSFNNSAVDGYAVKAEDTYGASPTNPIRLRVKGLLKPGDPPDLYGKLENGEAIEVYTGAPLPPGADAVIMYEDTYRVGDEIEVIRQIPIYANVNRVGDDVKRGELIISSGLQINPYHITLLVSIGVKRVLVYKPLIISILAIGDELIDPNSHQLVPGKKYASTDVLVEKYLEELGFVKPYRYGVVPDDPEKLSDALNKALEESNIVITIGGTSVSEKDIVPDYVDKHGFWIVRGIALRPGKTTGLAIIDGKPLFALSGNPVAAWVGLVAFVKPLLYLWQDSKPPLDPYIIAYLKQRVVNQVGYRSYVRVFLEKIDEVFYAVPYMVRGSSIVSSLAKSHGYIIVQEDQEGIEEGEEVKVHLFSNNIGI